MLAGTAENIAITSNSNDKGLEEIGREAADMFAKEDKAPMHKVEAKINLGGYHDNMNCNYSIDEVCFPFPRKFLPVMSFQLVLRHASTLLTAGDKHTGVAGDSPGVSGCCVMCLGRYECCSPTSFPVYNNILSAASQT